MSQPLTIAALLQEAAETHHRVYRITDGTDEDWASWYADWLFRLSEFPEVLGARPVRSHLACALVQLDRDHTEAGSDKPWPDFHERARLEVHLAQCPHCHEYLAQLRVTIRAAGHIQPEVLSDDAFDELVTLYRRWRAD